MDISDFEKLPLLGILRGVKEPDIEPLIRSAIAAGLKSIEVTMNTCNAGNIIKKAVTFSKGKIRVGAGTVINKKSLDEALSSGAEFIVMPAVIKEVISECVRQKIPVFPGAFTPTEVLTAWESGASMVKVFPSSLFGPLYIKELKGPFDKIKLMATGGVRKDNIKDFFKAGADAVAFGASVFKKEWIEKKDFISIESMIKDYVEEVKSCV